MLVVGCSAPDAPLGFRVFRLGPGHALRRRALSFGVPLPWLLMADPQYQRVTAVTVSASGTPHFASCRRLRARHYGVIILR